ncbi:MAG TPA: metallophosphoesterase [Dehalococcoidia bacterium]|nr:metallophosphoesterase [Dehalococcoidia bacterium]
MPYDLIGDVHGCREELLALLTKLGYVVDDSMVTPPAGRSVIFLGDLVNRGPDSPGVLRLVMSMVSAGVATGLAGNHDIGLAQALAGRPHDKLDAVADTLRQFENESTEFKWEVVEFLEGLPRQLSLDEGRLIVAHAGLPLEYHGIDSPEANDFAVNGRWLLNAERKRVRYDWAADYRGDATVVYGHASQIEARWVNRTICIDTGCVYGGRLTTLRYPERELVWVAANQVYYKTPRAPQFRAAAQSAT